MKQLIYFITLFAALLFTFSFTAQAQIITTIAGCDTMAFIGDGGAATAAGLAQPTFVALDAANNLYIADYGHNRIRMINSSGIITTIAGSAGGLYGGDNGPATDAQLYQPGGIKFDAAGNLYIADDFNSRIRKINTAGVITTIAGCATAGFGGDGGPATLAEINFPHDIAIDKSGNLFITDFANNRIRKVDTFGIITTFAGTGISSFGGDGGPATDAGIYQPYGITIDTAGNIIFAEFGSFRVREINAMGIISTIAGQDTPGYNGDNILATIARLNQPTGVALDRSGNIYIGDGYNYRVRKVSAAGIITTIAGTGVGGYSGDNGLAVDAEIGAAVGVLTDNSDNIFIADFGNNRIRMVTSTEGVAASPSLPQREVTVYPNPCNGNFIVNLSSSLNENATVTISDLLGRRIKTLNTTTNTPQNISFDAPDGIYLLIASSPTGLWTQRIVLTK